MAEKGAEMDIILQEWAPLSELLNKIPTKTQIGLFSHDVNLTCVDIIPEFIALGSNLGIVYWYDRKKKDLQRLRCENQNARITCIKVISTVDYMVACGNCDGQISVFQIPKTHPDCLPENLKPKFKQVERYTVTELHNSAITSLEWSKNGMKLFSGDKNGLVVLTELDFYMHLSKSFDILNEAYEVVQLSYCQQQLLVSTTFRTIVCQKYEKWKVCQVGKKDRKILGNYGGVFLRIGLKPKDILIYSTRPGLRIWISDLSGTVQQTLLFKDLLNKACFEVPLRNPITGNAKKLKPQKEANFGVLLPFGDNLLITYNSDVIYVLDPTNLLVIATISHLRRILSVSTYKDEIFVLEGERSLIRISFKPEPVVSDASNAIPTASTFLPITNSIKDLTNKLQTSSIISALPPLFESNLNSDYNVQTDITSVINAEEAYEQSPIRKPNQNSKIEQKLANQENIDDAGIECLDVRRENMKKYETDQSSVDNDDPILFKHRRRKKYKLAKNDLTTSVTSLSSTSSEERDSQVNRPCMLNVSTIGTIGPDLRSPDSILSDIENKEKLLAEMLNLDKIKFALENPPKLTATKKIQDLNNTCFNNFLYDDNNSSKENNIPKAQERRLNSGKSKKEDYYIPKLINKPANSSNTIIKQDIPIKQETKLNGTKSKENYDILKLSNKPLNSSDLLRNEQMNGSRVLTSASNYFEQSSSDVSLNQRREFVLNEPVLNYGSPSGSGNPNSIDAPACMTIPNLWKLQELTVNQDGSEASDSSLCDWEIIN